jgi:DNA-binding MarR family transcriptional regulator
MSKQLMSYLIDPLVAEGYLERRPDPSDGRGRLITLTARGRQAVRRAAKAIYDAETRWGAVHGSRRVATLRRVLEEVTAHSDH